MPNSFNFVAEPWPQLRVERPHQKRTKDNGEAGDDENWIVVLSSFASVTGERRQSLSIHTQILVSDERRMRYEHQIAARAVFDGPLNDGQLVRQPDIVLVTEGNPLARAEFRGFEEIVRKSQIHVVAIKANWKWRIHRKIVNDRSRRICRTIVANN
jgi:hypothetical protein